MLQIQKIVNNDTSVLTLSKRDEETYRFWLSKEGFLIGKYFVCICNHFNLQHENKSGKCLQTNCSFCCGFFREKQIELKVNLIKNPTSIKGFEEFLMNKSFPVPIRRTAKWWREWEKYLEVFNYEKLAENW